MKTRTLLSTIALCSTLGLTAAPLTESKFTEVIKDVNVVAQATKAAQPAKVNEVVKAPDLVRTGADSRAELTALDQTLTRIGANTVFSFEPTGRNINLQQGSILFHSPSGKGGGSIKSGGASAAVLGTTLIVVATTGGGFKVIMLEGRGRVTLPNGNFVNLNAGQIVFVLPGQTDFGPVRDLNLDKLVSASLLVGGFGRPLPSMPKIQEAVNRQNKMIASGRAVDTGISVDDYAGGKASDDAGGSGFAINGINSIDNNTYQAGTGAAVSAPQLNLILQTGQPIGMTEPGGRGVIPVRVIP